jgi:hypothetical protein
VKNNFIRRLYKQMFKSVQSGISKAFSSKTMLLVIIILIVLFVGINSYSSTKFRTTDGYDGMGIQTPSGAMPMQPSPAKPAALATPAVQAEAQKGASYAMQPVANPSDLLPLDQHSQWASLNPMGPNNIATPDLLQAGYHIGLDTIGQTLRNANLQFRSDPIIPKSAVGPWNQSTIEPDLGRVPLEIGPSS